MKRNTVQRNVIRHVLVQADRPMSTGEVLDTAKGQIHSLGIATVYRALRSLREEGFIQEVGLPGQPSRWELAGKPHHHHFLCDTCNKVFEVHRCPEGIGQLLPEGFTLEQHEILLQGQCVECADSGAKSVIG